MREFTPTGAEFDQPQPQGFSHAVSTAPVPASDTDWSFRELAKGRRDRGGKALGLSFRVPASEIVTVGGVSVDVSGCNCDVPILEVSGAEWWQR